MNTTILANLAHYIPELMVVATMLGVLLLEATYGRTKTPRVMPFITTLIGLTATFCALLMNIKLDPQAIFTNAVVVDPFSTFLKLTMVVGAFFVVLMGMSSKDIGEEKKAEFNALLLGVLFGAMCLASANNMLTLYLGIETLSIFILFHGGLKTP